jgi:hypothetical protein
VLYGRRGLPLALGWHSLEFVATSTAVVEFVAQLSGALRDWL